MDLPNAERKLMKNITPEDTKSGLRKKMKFPLVVPPSKEMLEEARKTISLPEREQKFVPSASLLKRWALEREEADLEDIQQNIMNVYNWKVGLADDFLDAWWSINPGLYNRYHYDAKGDGKVMIAELRNTSEGTFNFIWNYMVENLIEELDPERPHKT